MKSTQVAKKSRRRKVLRLGWITFLLPLVAFLIVFFIAPLVDLLGLSLHDFALGRYALDAPITFINYASLLGDSFYWKMLGNSLQLALCTTITSLIIGYAVAFYITRTSGWEQTIITVACLLPIFINIIVGILGWYIMLLPFGVLQQTLSAIGVIEGPLRWLRTFWALVAVLTYEHLPFAILILASSLQNVPADKIAAARVLGASKWQILWTVMLPLTMPGIVATGILVFSLSGSSYLVPILIAGPLAKFIPLSIFSFANELHNWNMAGALAFILLIVVVAITYGFLVLTNRLTRRDEWEMV